MKRDFIFIEKIKKLKCPEGNVFYCYFICDPIQTGCLGVETKAF